MTRTEEVETWYKANAENIKKWANFHSQQDAEDILQDTAIKLLKNPGKWEDISQLKTNKRVMWEFYNPERHFKGAGKVLVSLEAAEQVEAEGNLTETLIAKRSVELVKELTNLLGGASKSIFEMRFFQDMPLDDIAKKLDMPHGSVRQLSSRANKIIVNRFKEIMK